MNVIGFCALHYGKAYLASAIRSIINHVDRFHVIYSPVGSHGAYGDNLCCPDSRDELLAIAQGAAGDKLVWTEGRFPHEGAHRDMIYTLEPDADVVLVVDSDEVWSSELAPLVLSRFHREQPVRHVRLPFAHYWRSFYRAFLFDPAYPVRAIFPKAPAGEMTYTRYPEHIHHFGYAITPELMWYKWQIHGHRGELRRDVDWFKDVYLANRQTDCHPVGSEYWNADTVDPFRCGLPEWMRDHPYASMELIQ